MADYTLPHEGGSYTFDELLAKYQANDIGYRDLPTVKAILRDNNYEWLIQ